ncbi:hypothetical protein FQN50_003541 [Emmonsiellopsis sp. PD_5]|nr:hypothetical protein FQN50_003541 [Emmonsiellopsis sp. PD_5]
MTAWCLVALLSLLVHVRAVLGGIDAGDDLQSFHTLPNVRAVKFNVTYHHRDLVSPGYWFVAPYWFLDAPPPTGEFEPCQVGPSIYDADGRLVWTGACMYRDHNRNFFDFRVAEHVAGDARLSFVLQSTPDIMENKPTGYVLNDRYEVVDEVVATGTKDVFGMHEFDVLNDGASVLVCGDRPEYRKMDQLGRDDESWVTSGTVMELSVKTGEVLYVWNSRDEVSLDEGFHVQHDTPRAAFPLGLDYFHVNSVNKTPDGNYLVSARYTNTIYLLSGGDAPRILWRLGGKKSDFAMRDFTFSRQHNAQTRFQNTTHMVISFLNNASDDWSNDEPTSSALFVQLDLTTMTATLLARYPRPDHSLTRMRGNVQTLQNKNIFIGWSEGGYHTEHSPKGTLIMEARFAIPSSSNHSRYNSYRSYKHPFIGRPSTPPAAVASLHGSPASGFMTLIHASWNGATEVASWRFYARHNETAPPVVVGNATKVDFETEFAARGYLDWLSVEAVDRRNKTLGMSGVFRPRLPEAWGVEGWPVGVLGADDPGVLYGGDKGDKGGYFDVSYSPLVAFVGLSVVSVGVGLGYAVLPGCWRGVRGGKGRYDRVKTEDYAL